MTEDYYDFYGLETETIFSVGIFGRRVYLIRMWWAGSPHRPSRLKIVVTRNWRKR